MSLENQLDPTPSGDENDNLKQIESDITPQAPEQSTQQESSMAANESGKSSDRLSKETREKILQEINTRTGKAVEILRKMGKKEREIVAFLKQNFEQINLDEDGPLGNEPSGILLSDVEIQQIEWLWHGRIPLGKITLLDGDPGMGKSLLAINIAACVSTGHPMPDDTPGIQGGVILIAPEDSAEDNHQTARGGGRWRPISSAFVQHRYTL